MPTVKLQRRLLLLAAAAIFPLALMSGIGLFALANEQRAQVERAGLEISRALLTGVDAELGRSIAVLEAISTSPLIDAKNFSNFYELSQRVIETRPHWLAVILRHPDGTAILDTRRAFGAKLSGVAERDSFDKAVRGNEAIVGSLAKRQGEYAFAVRMPVRRAGKLQYILTAVVKPESILKVVQRQQLPDDWVVSVFDSSDQRVARSRAHAMYLGQPPAPSLKAIMDRGTEGVGMTRTLENQKIFTAYNRSPYTGWTVAIGIPPEFAPSGGWAPLAAFAAGVLISTLLAILAALFIARSISRPIGELAIAARELGRGNTPSAPVTPIQEIHQVADALVTAAAERTRNEAERERLFAREQEARATAEAANRAKDEFLAMLGHELRNPLSAISNATRLLDHPRVSAEVAREARAVIGRQVDHLARMTDDLLDAARAITGKIALHRKPINLADAVAATLATASLRAQTHHISQRLEPAWVNADPTRVEQIISNLLTNALKYTPAGGTVHVSVNKESNEAVLHVIDNGIGMPPELTARVFEPFVQGTRALDRSHGGLGIGLTLVRRLAELHGGSVEANSAGPDRGSEFIVRLPLIKDAAIESTTLTDTAVATPRDILIIEDNDDARNSLRQLLEVAGHRVRTAADGVSGLDAALATPPDVALIDIGLPKLDGYEVARRIRAADRTGPAPLLIALTGYGLPDDHKRALDAGFDAHLVKPVDDAVLQELLLRSGR